MEELKTGDIAEGIITGIKSYGAFVQFPTHQTGLIHISEISRGFVSDISLFVKEGQSVTVKIIDVDSTTHQLRLSLKALEKNEKKMRPRQKIRRPMKVTIGFKTLSTILPQWIQETMKEIKDDQISK